MNVVAGVEIIRKIIFFWVLESIFSPFFFFSSVEMFVRCGFYQFFNTLYTIAYEKV